MDSTIKPCACDHGSAVEEMRRQQVLVTRLRTLVLPSLWTDGRSELIVQLFEDLLSCTTSAISRLVAGTGGGTVEFVDDKSRVRKNLDERNMERLKEEARPNGQKRRRKEQHSRSLITHVPHYDGHEWRKYGQKHINNAKYPRSYYRCAYSKEQSCPVTKTIQQQENNDVGKDDPAKYTVVYHGYHTCKGENTAQLPHVTETGAQNSETPLTNLLILPEMHEFAVDFDVPVLLQAIAEEALDSDNWEMDSLIGFDQASSPIWVGGFNF